MKQLALFSLDTANQETSNFAPMPFNRQRVEALDFRQIPASTGIYGIHPYPAMFHFLVVRNLLENFSERGALILDPFMGSGVVAGECLIHGRNFIGYDINPLALLIAKARTTPLAYRTLIKGLKHICDAYEQMEPETVDFPHVEFWFAAEVIPCLSKLRQAIGALDDYKLRDFFLVAFSETVRRVSRTKYNEFKLLRRKEDTPPPPVWKVFREIAEKNISLLTEFYRVYPPSPVSLCFDNRDVKGDMPLEDETIDLVVTSPPYGDSKTTVAYGQFSRLSLQWLGLPVKVDQNSLGAKSQPIQAQLPSSVLYENLEKISEKDNKRAQEVYAFYYDLFRAIVIIARKVKPNGYVCFVVGNRRVKGIELPTDKISVDFFAPFGFNHLKTLVRAISNKRMPSENSPSNVAGEKDLTMRFEYIVILQKDH